MAELPEWAVDRACQYQDTDDPVTVTYFMSRPEILDHREAPFYCMSTEMPNSSKLSAQTQPSHSSAAVAEEGRRVKGEKVVSFQVLAALETLADWAKHQPFDWAEVGELGREKTKGETIMGNLRHSQHAGPQERENPEKQDGIDNQDGGPQSNMKEGVPIGKKKHSVGVPWTMAKANLLNFTDKKKAKRYEYALVCGITTQFNPGGMWIVEEFCNDRED